MVKNKSRFLVCMVAASIGMALPAGVDSFLSYAHAAPSASTSVAVIVNGNAITNYDIQRRKAFMRLQRRSGNLDKLAREELIEEMLKRVEMKRQKIDVSKEEIDNAFTGFAQRNRMTVAQLSQMLNQAGVTPDHFKNYIMVQMGWGRLISARYRAEGMVTEQDAVQRMLKNGGVKPTANEYTLQQVIFVVPANRRAAIIGKRRADANAFRARVQGCDSTRKLAKGMIDVTVRDLGRILEQQLPEEWDKNIRATAAGRTTPTRDTQRGVEFITVCDIRKTDEDRVAQLVFSVQDGASGEKKAAELEKKYLKELRDRARIQNP